MLDLPSYIKQYLILRILTPYFLYFKHFKYNLNDRNYAFLQNKEQACLLSIVIKIMSSSRIKFRQAYYPVQENRGPRSQHSAPRTHSTPYGRCNFVLILIPGRSWNTRIPTYFCAESRALISYFVH